MSFSESSPRPGGAGSSVAPPPLAAPRLLVIGCGGIGGVIAAHLFEQGHDVTAYTTNPLIADAINAAGFRVRGEASPGTVRGRAVREIAPGTEPFDYVLLATQPPQVEEAARSVVAHLAPTGAMVCFQNGLCEERIAAIAGPERTFGGIVAWGASMVEPGVYDRTSSGGFVLGRLDGEGDVRLDELARILEAIGPTSVTGNLAGARWSKLAINCAISSLGTIGGDRLGVLMRHRFVRRLGLEIMTEVVQVARAAGVRLEKVAGTIDLDWIALTDAERAAIGGSPSLFAKHALLLAVGARYRRLRSSMLAAIERGRPPAIDFLNGEVTARGEALGVPTPINAAARERVLAIAAGKQKPGLALLRALYEHTRALVGAPPATAASVPPPSAGSVPPASASGSVPPAAAASVPPAASGSVPPSASGSVPSAAPGSVPPSASGSVPPAASGSVPPSTSGSVPPPAAARSTPPPAATERASGHGDVAASAASAASSAAASGVAASPAMEDAREDAERPIG